MPGPVSATRTSPGARRDGDAAAGRRRAHRVLDQVREHLQHAVGVGRRRRAPFTSAPSETPTRRASASCRATASAASAARSTARGVTANDALVQPRQVEQVAHEPLEPLRLGDHDGADLLRRDHAVEQRLAVAADRRERRLQLVADREQERALGVARAVELVGHLVERGRERLHLVRAGRPAAARAARRRRAGGSRSRRAATGRATAPASRKRDERREQRADRGGDANAIVNGRQSRLEPSAAARSPGRRSGRAA